MSEQQSLERCGYSFNTMLQEVSSDKPNKNGRIYSPESIKTIVEILQERARRGRCVVYDLSKRDALSSLRNAIGMVDGVRQDSSGTIETSVYLFDKATKDTFSSCGLYPVGSGFVDESGRVYNYVLIAVGLRKPS